MLNPDDETEVASAQKQLGKRLRAAYCKSKATGSDNAKFIPISEIESLITQETVQDVLRQVFSELQSTGSKPELDKLTQDICPSRRRLFALLVLGSRAGCIRCFVQGNITDSDFPFTSSSDSATIHPRGDAGHERPLNCFREWGPHEVEWFMHSQHIVTSPFFDLGPESLCFYPLPKDSVLPFIESEPAGEGGHSNVWKVSIHPAHHNFPPQEVRSGPSKDLEVPFIGTIHRTHG